LSSDDYDFLLVIYKSTIGDGNNNFGADIIPKGKGTYIERSFNTGSVVIYTRQFQRTSNTQYSVKAGYNNTTTENNAIVPITIYGFKTSVDVDITAYMADLSTDAKNIYLESGENVEDTIAWKKIFPTNFIPTAVNTAVNQTFSELIGAEGIVVFIGQLQAHLYSVADNPKYNASTMTEVAKTNSPYEMTARIQWDMATGKITLTQTVKGTGANLYAVERIIYR
jgi:hypothetical protein